MTTRSTTAGTTDTSLATVVSDLAAEVQALRHEVGQLRQAVLTRTGADPQPLVQKQFTRPGAEPYSDDPRHDPAYVEAVMRGDEAGMKTAYKAAAGRISAELTERGGQPPGPAEYDLADRRRAESHQRRREQAEARSHLDLAGLPIEPGGVMTRDPQTGQVHISHPQQRTCSAGHPAEPGYKFCPTCGGPVGAPALGEVWQDRELREERQAVEGGYNPEMATAIAEDARIAREVS